MDRLRPEKTTQVWRQTRSIGAQTSLAQEALWVQDLNSSVPETGMDWS